MDPILEGLVTTIDPAGAMHFAPMGPRVSPDWRRVLLRPFPTSTTYRNLKAHGEGVLHVTDDVLLLAKAALGQAKPPAHCPATSIKGHVLVDACRSYEFVVRAIDESGERVCIDAEVVHSQTHRDFWGLNRAKSAVVEAAILATRLHILPIAEVLAEYAKLRTIVEKTGGAAEAEAFDLLQSHVDLARRLGGQS